MSFYSFIGVNGVPSLNDKDWKVLDHWIDLEDGSYQLTISSTTIAEKCKNTQNSFVVFPSVNLSINSVYIDGKLQETNSPEGSWYVTQVFYRPVIHCRLIKDAKEVRQEIKAYIKYMGAITNFPEIKNASFGFYFANSDLFYVAVLMIAMFTLVNSILVVSSNNIKKFKYSILQDISVLMVVLFFSPGKFFELSMIRTNEIFLPTLMMTVYLAGHLVNQVSKKRNYLFSGLFLLIYFVSIGNKNIIQIITLIVLPFLIIWLSVIGIKFYKNLKNINYDRGIYITQSIIIALIIICSVYDSYASNLLFNYFVLLPVAFVLLSLVNFLDIIRLVGSQKYENYVLKDEIQNQVSVINQLIGSQEKYQELLHDIKSPLTGLNFILGSGKMENPDMLLSLRNRFSDLLAKTESILIDNNPAWVSASEVERLWVELGLEYIERVKINYESKLEDKNLILYCEIVSLKAIFAELLDNSIKARVKKIKVEISKFDDKYLIVNYENSEQAVHVKEKVQSSGKGLKFIKDRIRSWDGLVDVKIPSYNTQILLKLKNGIDS